MKLDPIFPAMIAIAGTAFGAGDAPMKLNGRQAMAVYASVRNLLTNDGAPAYLVETMTISDQITSDGTPMVVVPGS